MGDFEDQFNFNELHEKIALRFEKFKEDVNSREHYNINYLLYNLNSEADLLLYKVKYEVDEYVKSNLFLNKEDELQTTSRNNTDNKMEMLVKLMSLSSMITRRIVNDFQKTI